MLEIDVDVGGLIALAADETLEEHVGPLGVHGGDAQAIADGGIGSGAATLTENVPCPGKLHQVPDRQEIGLVMQLFDEHELAFEESLHLVWNAFEIALTSAG